MCGTGLPERGEFGRDEGSALRMFAREEAEKAVLVHVRLCPFKEQRVEERLRDVQVTIGRLVGFMAGSGLLGGTVGAAIVQALGR
jgi:hypothetical protein